MEVSLQATAINCVIQDLRDRQYISSVKKQFDSLPEKDRQDQNIKEIIIWLGDIVNRNITEKQEALYEISNRDFKDNLRELIDDDTHYTKRYKRDILTKLSSSSSVATLRPKIEKLMDLIDKIELVGGKKSVNMLYEVFDEVDDLQKTAYKTRTMSSSGNIVIIDPIDNSTHNTIRPVLEELQQAVSNKIKSIPIIDGMVGSGFAPKTFHLFAAIGGNGKSLTLQNILLYASKNNTVDLFDLENGLKPCLVFISLELSKKQCFQRQLAWCGVKVTDDELKVMTEDELEQLVMLHAKNMKLNIPIVYIERIQGQYITSIVDIQSECTNLENMGFKPVMIAIDYIDRMDVESAKHRNLGMTGAEGSSLLRQKGTECRELAFAMNCPVISAAQLNGEAQGELTKVEPYLRQIDILHHFGTGMLAGSKQLQTEIETIIFQHKIEIENKSQESELVEKTEFIAFTVMKTRDGNAVYKLSTRDHENAIPYRKYTQSLKNSFLYELLKETSRIHGVVPLHGFKLDENDYAKSIRMYYTSDKSEFISLNDLISSTGGNHPVVIEREGIGIDDDSMMTQMNMDYLSKI